MEWSGIGGGGLGAFKDSAMDLYRTIVPTMRRCSSFKSAWRPGAAERRALQQQAENLKWQQDMYLRLVNLQGRCREGLVDEDDVASFRQKILDRVVVCFDGGECPGVTRDKLLFLQELLFSRCISEEEYHSVKKPLLYRLGDQGAEIDASDIIFATAAPTSAPSTPVARKVPETPEVCSKATEAVTGRKANNGKSPSKSPAKQLMQAVSRLKHGSRKTEKVKVPHALDFVRPKDCPVRDPPTALNSPGTPKVGFSDQCDSPLFHSPTSSVDSSDKRPYAGQHRDKLSMPTLPTEKKTTPGSAKSAAQAHKSPLSDESRVKAAEDVHAGAGDKEAKTTPKKAWRLDLLRPPKIITGRQETPTEKPKAATPDNSLGILSPRRAPKVTPDTVMLKKVHGQGKASTDFFIDRVLGENIKQELERIRNEMNRSSATQAFTNEQIEAISTRLPADKSELLRFFPKSWCDRYGDIVLDVVHKEFKGHIKEMEASRRTTKRVVAKQGENDENSTSTINTDGTTLSKASSAAPKGSVTRCFTTADNSNNNLDARSTNQGPVRTPRRKPLRTAEEYERELDGKLCAEIQKLPHGRTTPLRV